MADAEASSDLIREAERLHRLALDHPGRKFVPVAGARWGELILPAPDEVAQAPDGGLRVVLFASFEFGYVVLEAVKVYARRFPGRVQLVGLGDGRSGQPDGAHRSQEAGVASHGPRGGGGNRDGDR